MPNLAPDPAENDAAAVTPVLPLTVDQALVFKKCTDFVDFQLWPLNTNLNPEAWLPNFGAAEIEHAVHLLNSFMYFSETLVDHIFASAFPNLSNLLFSTAGTFSNTQKIWAAFVRQVLVTYVTGEVPNASDSGYLFARKAQQVLQLPGNQIVTPPEALEVLSSESFDPDSIRRRFRWIRQSIHCDLGTKISIRLFRIFRSLTFNSSHKCFICQLFAPNMGWVTLTISARQSRSMRVISSQSDIVHST